MIKHKMSSFFLSYMLLVSCSDEIETKSNRSVVTKELDASQDSKKDPNNQEEDKKQKQVKSPKEEIAHPAPEPSQPPKAEQPQPEAPKKVNVVVSNGLGDGLYNVGDVVHVKAYSKPGNTFKEWISEHMVFIKDKNKPEFTFKIDKYYEKRVYFKGVFLNPQGEIDH